MTVDRRRGEVPLGSILAVVALFLLLICLIGGIALNVPSQIGRAVGQVVYPQALVPAKAQVQPAAPTVQPTSVPVQNQPLYGLPPQPQIGHPSLYLETGVPCQNQPPGLCNDVDAHTRHWTITLQPGSVAIIGGFKVDGVENGVYKAVGNGTVDTTVTDGFVAITKSEWANAEFCFRVGQARQFGWAMGTVTPLSGWTECK